MLILLQQQTVRHAVNLPFKAPTDYTVSPNRVPPRKCHVCEQVRISHVHPKLRGQCTTWAVSGKAGAAAHRVLICVIAELGAVLGWLNGCQYNLHAAMAFRRPSCTQCCTALFRVGGHCVVKAACSLSLSLKACSFLGLTCNLQSCHGLDSEEKALEI